MQMGFTRGRRLEDNLFMLEWCRSGLEFLFQEQSYSSLHSGRSSACDHFRGDIDDPCGVIADFCGVTADFCGVIADPCGVAAIADRCATR